MDPLDQVGSDPDSFFILRDKAVVPCRKRFLESLVNIFLVDDRFDLQESSQDHHIKHLGKANFGGFIGCRNRIDVDVLSFGMPRDAIRIIDEQPTRFDGFLKFIEGLLVE